MVEISDSNDAKHIITLNFENTKERDEWIGDIERFVGMRRSCTQYCGWFNKDSVKKSGSGYKKTMTQSWKKKRLSNENPAISCNLMKAEQMRGGASKTTCSCATT